MKSNLDKKLTINEIFYSIQGESYLSGLPCVFIRLTGCHQRCHYCDTEYAFYDGQKQTLKEILKQVETYDCANILLTGGEPLLQENCKVLAKELLDQSYRVAIETAGSRDISVLPKEVVKILDLKTPDSGEEHRNLYKNIKHLEAKDEVKFVVTSPSDMDWSLKCVNDYRLDQICHVSASPTQKNLLPMMADKILASHKQIRLQTQFHKIIWPHKDKGF